MVSAVEAPARGLFTSALVPPLSINLPPVSLRRVRTRLFLLCFVSEMQTPMSAPGFVPGSRREAAFLFVCMHGLWIFCSIFAGSRRMCSSPFIGSSLLIQKEVIMVWIDTGGCKAPRAGSACELCLVNNELVAA